MIDWFCAVGERYCLAMNAIGCFCSLDQVLPREEELLHLSDIVLVLALECGRTEKHYS
jgi:hypothetical protein